jgi:Fe2+ or Zn2+ uptake regulation protein
MQIICNKDHILASTPNPDPLIQHARQALVFSGGRMTAQRKLILKALAESSGHPTAEEVYQLVRAKNPAINLSTVYRTLRWLEQEGLVHSRMFAGEPRLERFDPVEEPGPDHFHFRCRACNRIIEFDAPQLEQVRQAFLDQHGGQVDSASLVFYGLCADCEAAARIEPDRQGRGDQSNIGDATSPSSRRD